MAERHIPVATPRASGFPDAGTAGKSTRTCPTTVAKVVRDENARQAAGHLHGHDRLTCPFHETWLYRCVHSDAHVDALTGYRWCHSCRRALEVAVDELTAHVGLRCPACGRGATTRTDAHMVLTCERSLAAARAAASRRHTFSACPHSTPI